MTGLQVMKRRFAATSLHEDTREIWQRWLPVWHVFFYAILVAALGVALLGHTLNRPHGILATGFSVAFAAWYWGTIVLHPEWQRQPRPLALYFAGAIPLFLALIALDGAFFLVTSCIYLQLFAFPPLRWSIAGAALFTAGIVALQIAYSGQSLQANGVTVAAFVLPALLGMGLTYYIHSIIAQSAERRELIVELEATRRTLAERERLAGALQERQRLAGEIHDTLAQSLISIVMHLETADSLLPAEANSGREAIHRATAIARDSLSEARRSVHDLRPDALEGTSLPDALRRVAAGASEGASIVATTAITGTVRQLHSEVEVALLRVAQEAAANVRRHAGPCRMAVTLSFVEDCVILDVRDDGIGIAMGAGRKSAAKEGGYGLALMRQRIEALRGSFAIETAPGEGTTVTAMLPTAPDAPVP